MCWISNILNKQIAPKDIEVLKVVQFYQPLYQNNYWYKSIYYPNFIYTNNNPKINLIIRKHKGSKFFFNEVMLYLIDEGYHSFSISEEFGINFNINFDKYGHTTIIGKTKFGIEIFKIEDAIDALVIDAVIPKGAEYYCNQYGEIVSNKLIVKKLSKEQENLLNSYLY